MTNLHYAIVLIGALSLLLGLSLGQIYFQHQRIEQLEFNRFRQPPVNIQVLPRKHCNHSAMDRFWEQAAHEHKNERLQDVLERFNKETGRWESSPGGLRSIYVK